VNRRAFVAGLGAVLAAPRGAEAQPQSLTVIGFLSSRSPDESASVVAAFRQGLNEGGYVETQNVVIEFRWAEGRYDRLASNGDRSGQPSRSVDYRGRR